MTDWKEKLAKIKAKLVEDMEPPAETKKDNKEGKHVGVEKDGTLVYKERTPLQEVDQTKVLTDTKEFEKALDHAEDALNDAFNNLFGSGGKA